MTPASSIKLCAIASSRLFHSHITSYDFLPTLLGEEWYSHYILQKYCQMSSFSANSWKIVRVTEVKRWFSLHKFQPLFNRKFKVGICIFFTFCSHKTIYFPPNYWIVFINCIKSLNKDIGDNPFSIWIIVVPLLVKLTFNVKFGMIGHLYNSSSFVHYDLLTWMPAAAYANKLGLQALK